MTLGASKALTIPDIFRHIGTGTYDTPKAKSIFIPECTSQGTRKRTLKFSSSISGKSPIARLRGGSTSWITNSFAPKLLTAAMLFVTSTFL